MANLDHTELQRRLMRALDVAGKTHGPDDVARAVDEGRMQAWTAGDSLVVTEVLNYPQARALNVFLAVGNLDEVLSLLPDLEAFGREHGCEKMRMEGRKGWARVLPSHGWKENKLVIYERTLTDG